MSPFEVVYGYKPGKPLDLFLMSPNVRVYRLIKSFVCKVQDLHVEITK